ncbi:MAG: hypothetical protein ACD_4C00136G0018 [uncultured bacterium (gcode 4)]|uniref:Uncharacterized protein n=1 Tax=uncultured bacterium (gcode 4) TaxID=1234023 RepID=K2FV71_9BACT|nr:MAG: hypothetical protein ACD_4C00136G0018 [uncultured bacterium (gcode 4)]
MKIKGNIFPEIKKEIRGFLMDESWKITKQDSLKLAFLAVVLSVWLWNETNALNTRCVHSSSCSCGWSC